MLLRQVLPLEDNLGIASARAQIWKIGQRLEDECSAWIERSCEEKTFHWYPTPTNPPAYAIELDAGHVRSDPARNWGRRWMSVVASRIIWDTFTFFSGPY